VNKFIKINGRKIGDGYQPYIIAELSANHNGDITRAKKIIKKAKLCGADAIKIQTYTADTMTINCHKSDFQIKSGLWKGYNLYELYKWAETPFEWHQELFQYAKELDISIFSTPFDETAVDLLEKLKAPAYKVASFEATDIDLIKYIASKGKPMIISTGLANYQEVVEAYETVKKSGCKDLVFLHCISSYPAPVEQSNISTIAYLKKRFKIPIGLSDHTITNTTALGAVALGANVIEKHFTIDRKEKGPDSEFSMLPKDLKELCNNSREVWTSIGSVNFKLKKAEKENIRFRRSIYFIKPLKKNETITREHIARIRPGFGLPPKYFRNLIGKKVTQNVTIGTPAKWSIIK
tara:strand:- start:1178 stop:2227 length:1050 start_codon:yes stop_codon:yes gene_type:complete